MSARARRSSGTRAGPAGQNRRHARPHRARRRRPGRAPAPAAAYLADDGHPYEEAYAVIPGDLSDVADLYDGAAATGNVLFELPADQLPGGVWGVSYRSSDPLWWAAS